MENKMFTVKRYGAWWWIVIDNETNLAVKKSDGTLLLFKDKESAQEWVEREEKLFDKIYKWCVLVILSPFGNNVYCWHIINKIKVCFQNVQKPFHNRTTILKIMKNIFYCISYPADSSGSVTPRKIPCPNFGIILITIPNIKLHSL